MEGEELAPALSGAADASGFNADTMSSEFDQSDTEAIEDRLGSFFDDEVALSSEGWVSETAGVISEQHETETEIESENDSDINDGIIAALSEFDEEGPGADEDNEGTDEQEILEDSEVTEQSLEKAEEIEGEDEAEDETTIEDPIIFDDEPVAALFDSEEDIVTEDTDSDESEEALVEDELSFLDDDIDDESEEILPEDKEPESDTDTSLTFPDDEPAPALFDSEEDILAEDTDSDKSEEEVALVEDGLSFLDDDIDDEPEIILPEGKEPESDTDASLSFLDDDTASFDASESENVEVPLIEESFEADEAESPIVEPAFAEVPVVESEDEAETAVEEVIDFFDDVDEPAEDADEIAFEVETEDVEEYDEIEFTVPGEETVSVPEEVVELEQIEEEIEFAIPGEIAAPVAAVAAVAGAAISATQKTEPEDFTETNAAKEDEEVIFEAVDDAVELDLLPGEEFDDSVLFDADTESKATEEELVEFTAAEEVLDTGRYESLGILVTAIQDNVSDDGIQDLLTEVNKLRSSKDTSYSDKTFLQVLSTVSQFVDKNRNDVKSFSLLKEIVSGLEMSDSSDVSRDVVHEKLFTCTSQTLLLRAKDEAVQVVEPEEIIEENAEIDEKTEEHVEASSFTLKGEDEQLASFVQKELADIRKLFVEEIGSLRKELADKN